MSMYVTGTEDLLLQLNAITGYSLKLSDLILGTVTPTSADEINKYHKNSKVRVTLAPGATAAGTTMVYYDRLDVSKLTLANYGAGMPALTDSIPECSQIVRKFTGAVIGTDDIDVVVSGVTEALGTLDFSIKTSSVGWFGEASLQIPIVATVPRTNEVITDTNLKGLNYPEDSLTATFGQMYLTPFDFTLNGLVLKPITTGVLSTVNADALVTVLKAVDTYAGKTLWNNDAASTAWSLNGATVMKNGLNTDPSVLSNPAYKYVMVLKLRSDVTKPLGQLYLHYNEPFDPTL